jgi:hypothetical protein
MQVKRIVYEMSKVCIRLARQLQWPAVCFGLHLQPVEPDAISVSAVQPILVNGLRMFTMKQLQAAVAAGLGGGNTACRGGDGRACEDNWHGLDLPRSA